jgi:hypothetical protein
VSSCFSVPSISGYFNTKTSSTVSKNQRGCPSVLFRRAKSGPLPLEMQKNFSIVHRIDRGAPHMYRPWAVLHTLCKKHNVASNSETPEHAHQPRSATVRQYPNFGQVGQSQVRVSQLCSATGRARQGIPAARQAPPFLIVSIIRTATYTQQARGDLPDSVDVHLPSGKLSGRLSRSRISALLTRSKNVQCPIQT